MYTYDLHFSRIAYIANKLGFSLFCGPSWTPSWISRLAIIYANLYRVPGSPDCHPTIACVLSKYNGYLKGILAVFHADLPFYLYIIHSTDF